jgi:putative transposase
LGRDPKEVFSKDGLFDELKKALAERVLNAELTITSLARRQLAKPITATAIRRRPC